MESQSADTERALYVTPIANPIATDKLSNKLLTLTTKSNFYIKIVVAKVKLIRRGVKEVNKAFRKKELGYQL
jgi:hypothetical protein